MNGYQVGLGFDVHKFSTKKKSLILGGMKIPAAFSLEAVSDGDLILHAVSDSILGAAGLGDIGDYFPPESKQSKNIDSIDITRFVLKKIGGKYKIENVDIIIVADKPRLVKYKQAITKSLRKILVTVNVNLKIKSKEGQNILGTKNGMSCLAVALLKEK
ncbi:MAG: 2-C-methyl-D-erythritol 2,4-cyclodiphosphate synthase [Candidatus Omnitrophica bacterium]|nr:2-C-methyl-D-erythritol 2,4-cyclodiphosphate synthase [Candidatus Omnitrophota bacterium]